jgi:Fur family ferric uptake transcriptional regulator
MTDSGEVIEFCDPRIQTIKKTIEEIFDIEITNHSLVFLRKQKAKTIVRKGIIQKIKKKKINYINQ